ncbi:MAG: hypothetical protein ABI954_01400 [Pyrinomonadaceae bacterium]
MSDWIGLGFLILLIVAAWIGLRILSKPRKLTAQEFERRVNEGGGLVNAGMLELDKFLNPQAAKSIEVIQELKSGKYNKKQNEGDGDDKNSEQ